MWAALSKDYKTLKTRAAALVGVTWVLFQVYTALFGELSSIPQRTIHLGFAFTFLFLTRPLIIKGTGRLQWLNCVIDGAFLAGGVITTVYLAVNDVKVAAHLGQNIPHEFWFGVILTIVVMEGTRRVVGWSLPIVTLFFLAYALYGQYLPGNFGHRPYSLDRIVGQFYLSTEGVFGVAISVSAGFLFMFLVFATFLRETGGGEFFTRVATALFGRAAGGPAKIAVIASGFFGSISGSAVSNVVGTGSFTIPLMKKVGYRPQFAGAVEAVASTGGVIMPPVMGATAFIMAEILQVPYSTVIRVAIIPALLYYMSLFMMVHFEARRVGLRGLTRKELPDLKETIRTLGHLAVPLVVLVLLIIWMPNSPSLAGALGTIFLVVVSMLRKTTRMSLDRIFYTIVDSARAALDVALTCGCVGIVIGVVMLTGLGTKLAALVMTISGGSLIVITLLTALASIILGMGLPITPAYLILVITVAPVLEQLGFLPLAIHMFMLYFGAISFITPPVALAAYAGAGVAGANSFSTGFTAFRLGLAGYLVPFAFIFNPSLITMGTPGDVILSIITASAGVITLASGSIGYALGQLNPLQRLLMIVSAPLMIVPGFTTDMIGFAIAGTVVLTQWLLLKRNKGGTEEIKEGKVSI